MLFYCCRPEREEAPAAEPAAPAPTRLPYAPPLAILAPQDGSGPILQRSSSKACEGSGATAPSSSLLEAAARRVAAAALAAEARAAEADAAASAGLCTQFVDAYMAAVKEGNVVWASAPVVAGMLAPDVVLSQEGRSTHGHDVVVRRLERGVETLIKLGGQGGEAPTYTLSGPRPGSQPGRQVVECALRRGSHRMLLVLEFGLKGGKIATMDFRRGKAA